MKTVMSCALILVMLSCTKSETDYISPEYPDWYTVRSPIDDVIQGLWGNYDGTLLIATTHAIFRSTDQGKSWQQVDQQQKNITGIVSHNDTLFATSGEINTNSVRIVTNVSKYSTDEGNNWSVYQKHSSFFDIKPFSLVDPELYTNLKTASNGTVYKINQVYLDSAVTVRRYETPGLVTSNGRKIDLPQRHQLRSVYIDDKNRLYVTTTDVICDRNNSGFVFCNSKNGRGFVYISKQSLP